MSPSRVLHPTARLARLFHNHRPECSIVLATPLAHNLNSLRQAPSVQNSVQNFLDSGVRPCGWTELSGCFDRLPGVLVFELRGA